MGFEADYPVWPDDRVVNHPRRQVEPVARAELQRLAALGEKVIDPRTTPPASRSAYLAHRQLHASPQAPARPRHVRL